MNPLFAKLPTSIFEKMSALARAHDAVNLGQGFPDFGWPQAVLEKAAEAVRSGSNQYPPMRGLPELREAVAAYYRRRQDLDVQADQVTITSGATEALADAIMALIEPGDEVLLFQPLYDAYLPLVLRAGGQPSFVRLSPPDWRITEEALAEAFTERTRLVVFNNPHNPTARMFDSEELSLLARHCVRRDAIVLSDEVWEHLVFDGRRHIPLSSLPGMAERTVKVGSAGKIFSLTGWKVGWMVAPIELATGLANAHQFVTFATPPPLQAAVAFGLEHAMTEVDDTCRAFTISRDRLASGLQSKGFAPLAAEGTYFLSIDLAASGIGVDDVTFCERAVREAGVAAVPISAFYAEAPVSSVIRLCFAKKNETLDLGIERLSLARDLFV
ncbi:MAG TPA: aminotransferase [Allosphingosinicella sp.]|nr:aminotransferase [Allosphingosinicella sp.]